MSALSLEGGFGYNIFAPKDYRGGLWQIQIALTPPFSFSLSGSGLGPITGNPWTFTGGPYGGIPGASITYQEFGYETIPIPDP